MDAYNGTRKRVLRHLEKLFIREAGDRVMLITAAGGGQQLLKYDGLEIPTHANSTAGDYSVLVFAPTRMTAWKAGFG